MILRLSTMTGTLSISLHDILGSGSNSLSMDGPYGVVVPYTGANSGDNVIINL